MYVRRVHLGRYDTMLELTLIQGPVEKNLDVKLEDPRSLIVNLARNNANLEMLVNSDVDVVKYQYYI